ncbi:MAG: tRNA glutamyl-Q(34) synthetase GluQRS [Rhodocyclaceae bacterium]
MPLASAVTASAARVAAARRGYRGRFAPSPSGPLHFGSLVAALASWLDARAAGGAWLVRIEDIDARRSSRAAEDAILRALSAFGLEWDEALVRQSGRTPLYREAFERLERAGRVFGCRCSRREIADSALGAGAAAVYPGTCRKGLPAGSYARAWRLRVEPGEICFEDRLQGRCCQDLAREVGDFVVARADGSFTYQLAVVVDDAAQGVTDVVRGADLLGSTARQILLQRLLGLPRPRYLHVPVAVDAGGCKLSKQTHARALDVTHAQRVLPLALSFLGHAPPRGLAAAPVAELLAWATEAWSVKRIPRAGTLPAPDG